MKHIHHIIPEHMKDSDVMREMGLNDINDPLNLTPPISIELHAALHKDLFEHYGELGDELAWKALSGQPRNGIAYWTGKHLSPEHCAKLSKKATGRLNLKKRKTYNIQCPDGHIESVTGIVEFARFHNFKQSNLVRCGHAKGFVLLN